MTSRAWLVALALAIPVARGPSVARAEVFGASFRSTTWGVEMTVPRGWELSDQSAYPGIVARAYEHKGKARMTLAAQKLAPTDTLRTVVERNQKTLEGLGYKIVTVNPHPTGALLLESLTRDGKRDVRQAYLGRGDTVYVLSMAVAAEQSSGYLRPFEETLRGLSFTTPVPAAEPSAPSSTEPTPR